MDIPPEKKSTSYITVFLTLVVGVVLGALVVIYIFFSNRALVCRQNASPAAGAMPTTTVQTERTTVSAQNTTLFGIIVSKDSSSFTLKFSAANLQDPQSSTATQNRISFDAAKDEVVIVKRAASAANTIKPVTASFADIEVGQQVIVKIVDGKKTVYLTPSS